MVLLFVALLALCAVAVMLAVRPPVGPLESTQWRLLAGVAIVLVLASAAIAVTTEWRSLLVLVAPLVGVTTGGALRGWRASRT